jgi:hypothetical protein
MAIRPARGGPSEIDFQPAGGVIAQLCSGNRCSCAHPGIAKTSSSNNNSGISLGTTTLDPSFCGSTGQRDFIESMV